MNSVNLTIGGMNCGHCVGAVTKALKSVEGVEVDSVTLSGATVRFDPSKTSMEQISRAVEKSGYRLESTAA